MRRLFASMAAFATTVAILTAPAPASAQTEVTLWSHWAAEKIKRDFVEDAIRRFEEKNPGVKIKASWYEKTALYAALKTALRGPVSPHRDLGLGLRGDCGKEHRGGGRGSQ